MNRDVIERWAQGERCRQALLHAAAVLRGRCQLIAFKGVSLLDLDEVPARMSVDADAVACGMPLNQIAAALRDAGWDVARLSTLGTLLAIDPVTRTPVDIHLSPLPPGLGRLTARRFKERAIVSGPRLAGVFIPDPLDAACICLAHHAKDGFGTTHGHGEADRDLRQLIARFGISPEALCARLREHRLRKIAALSFDALKRRDPAWSVWLDSCVSKREAFAIRLAVDWILSRPRRARYFVPFVVRAFGDDLLSVVRGTAACSAMFVHDWIQHAIFRIRHGVTPR